MLDLTIAVNWLLTCHFFSWNHLLVLVHHSDAIIHGHCTE